jgi:hypothetical protein
LDYTAYYAEALKRVTRADQQLRAGQFDAAIEHVMGA